MAGRSTLGVSPIIATLLLIVIAVAASVVVYMFVSGMISVNQPEPITTKISIDMVSSDSGTITIYARNAGSGSIEINTVYLEGGGSVIPALLSPAVTIPSGSTAPITIPNNVAKGTYVVKIASGKGVLYAQSFYIGGDSPTPPPPSSSAVLITLNSPSPGAYNTSALAINASATSINSTIASVVAVVDATINVILSSSAGFYTGTTPALADGAHTVYVTASDALGASNSTAPIAFTVDLSPPAAVFNSPMNTSYARLDVPVNVSVSDTTGIASVVAEINGAYNVTLALQSGFYANTTAVTFGAGSNLVKIFASDNWGHAGPVADVYLTVDVVPPAVTINSPTNSTYTTTTIPLNVSAVDASGISTILAEVNGAYNLTLAYQGGFYVDASASFSQGANSVRIFASDTAGNMNSTQSVQFSVYPGLAAWWRMNEGAGAKVNDSSPNANNGTATAAVWVPGVSGTALNFTGANSVSVNNSASLRMSGDITMIAWIYFKGYAQSTYAYILERGSGDIDNYAMFISNSGLEFECQKSGGGYVNYNDGKGAIPQNKWVQVAITFNDANNTLIFYRNGTKTREINALTFQLNGAINANLLIGSQNYGSYYFRFKGAMDEIMLFNRALPQSEITAIYDATKPW